MPNNTPIRMLSPGPPDATAKRRLQILADGRMCVVVIECESKADAQKMAAGAINTVQTKGTLTFTFQERGPTIWMPPSPRARR